MASRIQRTILFIELCCIISALAFATFTHSPLYARYQEDILNNAIYCNKFKINLARLASKECQSLLFKTLDDPTALYTAFSFAATTLLFLVTYRLFQIAARESDKAEQALAIAQVSAEAAKRTAILNQALERPYLVANVPTIDRPDAFGRTRIRYGFINFGKTPGSFRAIFIRCEVVSVIPENSQYVLSDFRGASIPFTSNATISCVNGLPFLYCDDALDEQVWKEIKDKTKLLFFRAVAVYQGVTPESLFRFVGLRFDPDSNIFVSAGGNHNYDDVDVIRITHSNTKQSITLERDHADDASFKNC